MKSQNQRCTQGVYRWRSDRRVYDYPGQKIIFNLFLGYDYPARDILLSYPSHKRPCMVSLFVKYDLHKKCMFYTISTIIFRVAEIQRILLGIWMVVANFLFLLTLCCWKRNVPRKLGWYHGYWCPDLWRRWASATKWLTVWVLMLV